MQAMKNPLLVWMNARTICRMLSNNQPVSLMSFVPGIHSINEERDVELAIQKSSLFGKSPRHMRELTHTQLIIRQPIHHISGTMITMKLSTLHIMQINGMKLLICLVYTISY